MTQPRRVLTAEEMLAVGRLAAAYPSLLQVEQELARLPDLEARLAELQRPKVVPPKAPMLVPTTMAEAHDLRLRKVITRRELRAYLGFHDAPRWWQWRRRAEARRATPWAPSPEAEGSFSDLLARFAWGVVWRLGLLLAPALASSVLPRAAQAAALAVGAVGVLAGFLVGWPVLRRLRGALWRVGALQMVLLADFAWGPPALWVLGLVGTGLAVTAESLYLNLTEEAA